MNLFKRLKEKRKYREWQAEGKPVPPPPLAKQRMNLDYAKRFHLGIFVETGTFKGDTLAMMRPHFDRLYSVELADSFYHKAARRFRGDNRVEILHGDSARLMPDLVARLDAPTLFWLDGHYSGGDTAKGDLEAPVWPELRAIFGGMNHPFVVLIDDARCFTNVGAEDYPAITDIESWIEREHPDFSLEVEMDCIRIAPRDPAKPPRPSPSRAGEHPA